MIFVFQCAAFESLTHEVNADLTDLKAIKEKVQLSVRFSFL